MSRIPKFESKLKAPRTMDNVGNLPEIPIKNRRILRRSKSFEVLSNSALKPIINNLPSKSTTINNIALKKSTTSLVSRDPFHFQTGRVQTEDGVPDLPVIKKRPVRTNLRRSKSFSEMTSRNRPNFSVPTNVLKPTTNILKGSVNNKFLRTGNTKDTISAKPAIKSNVTSRVGVKRPNESSCNSEVKNKVVKKAKVPDWDFKTRFKLLQEAHNNLQSEFETASKTVEDAKSGFQLEKSKLQESLVNAQEQIAKLNRINEELKKNNEYLKLKEQELSTELEVTTRQMNNFKNDYELYHGQAKKLSEEKDELLSVVFEGEKKRREMHNLIQDLKGNIRVFCRLRPALNEMEKINQCNFNFTDDNSIEISRMRGSIAPGGVVKSTESQDFTFDKVFDQNASQEAIFAELSQLIQSAMDGYHICVFAYGQTGSGKTYTMQGESFPDECLGMIPRSVDLIFKRKEEMQKMGWSYKIKVSFLEIYNEIIRDLLDMKSGKSLDIRYNEGKGTTVPNLTVVPISSAQELLDFMSTAQKNRSTAVTNFNEHSSRSHAVTKIYIEAHHQDTKDVYIGSVSLVDLAGSESAKSVSKERLPETKNINKSLSSLGNVMMALYKKETHIPYRNSKLTFLLQSSLGGNCKCLMIVNISPINDSYNESINALRFAAKVKEVKVASTKNKLVTPSK